MAGHTFSRDVAIKTPVITVRALEWLFSSVNQLVVLQLAIFNLKELCQIKKLKIKNVIVVHRFAAVSALGRLEPLPSVCRLVFHQIPAIVQCFIEQCTYGSVSAGREKWPFNVLFFLKVEPPCDQT